MAELLDLVISLETPGDNAPAGMVAKFKIRCPYLGLEMSQGEWLEELLTDAERAQLRWYLEEYWQWPYDEFAARARRIEGLLPQIGRRLYERVLSHPKAVKIVSSWENLSGDHQRQISLVGSAATAMSLPWELLHDEQGYLTLRARGPVAIVRQLPQSQFNPPIDFTPPLRVLLVTARPEDAGFVDPRTIARELLDEVQGQVEAGELVVEFLRPPTLAALNQRLSDESLPPIHILHFDGHGVFAGTQGLLAFENAEGKNDLVTAERLGQILNSSGVKLAVLTACQSAVESAEDVFSSVAAQLIKSGVDAVAAMSASVLVASATRYVEAFYRELAKGTPVPMAQEKTRRALYADPKRHIQQRTLDKKGQPVELQDWWLPHFYQQRALTLRPKVGQVLAQNQAASEQTPRLNEELPPPPRYQFGGRGIELLKLERALLGQKLVVLHGFGGVGKTALAREAADWLTRTGMYERACFVSFEPGGNANSLLSQLGYFLGIYGADYVPEQPKEALAKVQKALADHPTLVIADNVESILPGGEAALREEERQVLWETLRDLAGTQGGGVLVTSRSTNFGDGLMAPGQAVTHLTLAGLWPDDAYELAGRVLAGRGIDRRKAPYSALKELLKMLDHHPLAIQLVIPALDTISIEQVRDDFAALLPKFTDDNEKGRNRSLLASLEYSLRRLGQSERDWLARLAVFEGGASEDSLLAITEIPLVAWTRLRQALEEAALILAEQVANWASPFLHFHPVLVPYLRGQGQGEAELTKRYTRRYAELAEYVYREDHNNPFAVRALVRRELPNLRCALEWWRVGGEAEVTLVMTTHLVRFLGFFGLRQEMAELWNRAKMLVKPETGTGLNGAEYLSECGQGEYEYNQGKIHEASTRFERLLTKIKAGAPGSPYGPGSYECCLTLNWLGRCFKADGQPRQAEQHLREGLEVIEELLKQQPENKIYTQQRAALLTTLGDALLYQGHYQQARQSYEQSLKIKQSMGDVRAQAVVLGQLGTMALLQRDYSEAQKRHEEARQIFVQLEEHSMEAVAWHQLGMVAEGQKDWAEAERCYRESLALSERLGNQAGVAQTCNQLAIVAVGADRPAEAETWYQRALTLDEKIQPNSADHATRLTNLASLIKNEVKAGRVGWERLTEAREYAEKALLIEEQLDLSTEPWKNLNILAQIAEMEGQTEEVKKYRRRQRETYATFEGNRWQLRQQFGNLIRAIGAVASGETGPKAPIEEVLPHLEKNGWHVEAATRQIWIGERSWESLVENLDVDDALFVKLVLEEIAGESQPLETVQAGDKKVRPQVTVANLGETLPAEIQTALNRGDQPEISKIMQALPPEE